MALTTETESLARGVAGLIILATVAILWADLASDPALTETRGRDPGPAFQPLVMLALLGASGLGLGVTNLWRYFASAGDRQADRVALIRRLNDVAMPALMIVTLLIFIALVPATGFLVMAFVFSAGWALALAWQDRAVTGMRGVAVAVACALAFSYGLYALFSTVIGVPL